MSNHISQRKARFENALRKMERQVNEAIRKGHAEREALEEIQRKIDLLRYEISEI